MSEKEKKNKYGKDEAYQEPDYDIFDLDRFGDEDERFSKKGLNRFKKSKADKKAQEKPQVKKAPPKPREPLKPFVPHTPVEMIEADVYKRDESLYSKQSVDIDSLFEHLTADLGEVKGTDETKENAEEVSAETAEETFAETSGEVADETPVENEQEEMKVYGEEKEMEDISSVAQDKPSFEESSHVSSDTRYFSIPEEAAEENSIGATRYFNIKSYIKNKSKNISDGTRKINIRKGVRVLDNKKSDESILEAKPLGDGKDSMMDSLDAKEGEDIFALVEKARQDDYEAIQQDISYRLGILKKAKVDAAKNLAAGKKKLIALSVTGILALILTVLPSFYTADGSLEVIFGTPVFALVNLGVFAAAAVIIRKELLDGIKSIRFFSPDKNAVTVVIGIFTLLFSVILSFTGDMGVNVKPFTLCFVFAAMVRSISIYTKDFSLKNALDKIIENEGECDGIHLVESRNDALAMAHGLAENTVPSILYPAYSKADGILAEKEETSEKEDKFYSISCMSAIIAAFAVSVMMLVKGGSAGEFMTMLMSALCLCLPVVTEFTSSVLTVTENRRVLSCGGYIRNDESLIHVGKANAVVSSAAELFTPEVSRFRRVKGASISQSDSAVFAAAALTAGGSMLGECFKEYIKALEIELPEAEDIQYEEKLGFACWIVGRRVLVGNRQMLTEHSITAPSAEEESLYAGKKSVMYVAVEGELAASFLVQYKVKKYFRKIASHFNKSGLVLLLSSKEPALDEVGAASRLSVEVAGVKLLSGKAPAMAECYRQNSDMGKDISLISLKKKRGFLPLVLTAHNLYNIRKTAGIINIAGQVSGLIFAVICLLLNISLFTNPVSVILFHILWTAAAVFAVSEYSRNYVKNLFNKLFTKGGKKK